MNPSEHFSGTMQQSLDNDQLFELLYTDFFTPIYRYVFFRLRDHENAMDITQTVFLKAWQQGDRLDHHTATRFLYTVARNQLIDHLRKKRSISLDDFEESCEVMIDHHISHPEQYLDTVDQYKNLHEMVKILPELQRDMITLHYFQELDYSEIAAITGKSEEAIRQSVSRGMQALRKHFNIINDYEPESKQPE